MTSIDTNEIFEELNSLFKEYYECNEPSYHDGSITIPQFRVWYYCKENVNMETIIKSWILEVEDLINDYYIIELEYDEEASDAAGAYCITFTPDIKLPRFKFISYIRSSMGVVKI